MSADYKNVNNSFTTWAEAEAVLSEGMPIEYIKSAGEPLMLIVKHNGAYGCCADGFEVYSTLRGAYTSLAYRGYDANIPRNWRKVMDGDMMALAQAIRDEVMTDG